MTEQLTPMEQQHSQFNQGDVALIKEIYELTHKVSTSDDLILKQRLIDLHTEAEKRKLL